jgi:hypothetical protein
VRDARPLAVFIALAAACHPAAETAVTVTPQQPTGIQLAEPDDYQPSYGKPEVERALIAERGAEASQETKVAQLQANAEAQLDRVMVASIEDNLRAATADLAVRRQFIRMLEACEAEGRWCPPRLDESTWSYDFDSDRDPPLDAQLRFDLADWQKIAAELHGRACACRTVACVDGVGAAIDRLEPKPMRDVQGDEIASESITRARQCLFRLQGRAGSAPRHDADDESKLER